MLSKLSLCKAGENNSNYNYMASLYNYEQKKIKIWSRAKP